jgi:hypothetical protein
VERYRATSLLARMREQLGDDIFTEAVARAVGWTAEDVVAQLLRML